MKDEILLTELIESLLDWQEEQQPDIFKYKEINFREAVARYIYFKSIEKLSALIPLVMASTGWEASNKNLALLSLYNETKSLMNFKQKGIIFFQRVLAFVLIIYIKLISYRNKAIEKTITNKNTIGFYAFNSRFVFFYESLIKKLDDFNALIFSHDIQNIKQEVLKVGAMPQSISYANIEFSKVNIQKRHELYPIFTRQLYFYSKILGSIQSAKIALLVFAEGTSHYDEIASQTAKSLNIPTIRVQSGRGGVLHCGYRNMSFDRMLCWGEGFVERYKKYSPLPEYEVVGSPLATQLKDKRAGNSFSIGVFTQPVCMHISDAHYSTLVNLCALLNEEMPELNIIVRKHPADKSLEFEKMVSERGNKIKLMSAPDYTLQEVMCEIKCAVSFFSTTISEAAFCGVLPIILKLDRKHSVFPYPEQYGAAIVASSINEVHSVIEKYLAFPEDFEEVKDNMHTFSQYFFNVEDESDPLQKMTESIKATMMQSTH